VARWSAEQWNAISLHLDHALDLAAGERDRWLSQLDTSDPGLAKGLRELLAAQASAAEAQFMERSPLAREAEPVAGQSLGAYTLESRLGSGGMGSVWLAQRSDGHFEAKVAIKILDHRGLGGQGAAQIRREAGLLAQQSHPNTAKLFDAGFGENGQPFLILEYVEGQRIDEYCERHGLTLPERLRLFLPVLEAVAHAHERQIVHRDLKPSNILVTRDGVAKLLDFGVASVISKSMPMEAAIAQREAPLWMTPGYAAPEQIRGEEITPASDVYALGVMLHMLITGQHPYMSESSTQTRLIRAVLTDDAQPASESIESGMTKRWVRGELDAVIAKAIEREPARRYASAAELAADIRRFLSYRPVRAREHSAAQRLFMFIRRNKAWVIPIVAGAVLVAAVVGSGIVWKLSKARQQSAIATIAPPAHSVAVLPFVDMSENKDQAYFSDGLSEELIDQLTKVPDLTVPARTSSFYFKGKQATIGEIAKVLGVAQVLEGSVRKSGNTLRVTAQLIRADNGYHLWSETYDRNMDDVFKIQDEIAAAVVKALKVSLLAGSSADISETRSVESFDLYQKAIFEYTQNTGGDLTQDILDLLHRSLKIDPSFARAWALLSRALVFQVIHRPDSVANPGAVRAEAMQAAERAAALSPNLTEAHVALGRAYELLERDLGKAEGEFNRALQLSPRNSDALMQLSSIAARTGRADMRASFAERALAADPLNPYVLAMNGRMNLALGKLNEAEVLFKRLKEVSPQDAYIASNLGLIFLLQGKPAEALAEFEKEGWNDDLKSWYEALIFPELGRRAEADAALLALEHGKDAANKDGLYIAEIYAYRGDKEQALSWLEKAYEANPQQLGNQAIESELLNNVKTDPRFEALRKKTLPQ
jgi:TolB-like protein/serine/threonine protein kinase/Flp pilus assembly protein TadD